MRSPTQHLGPEEKEQLLSSGNEGQGHNDRPQMFCDCPQLPAEPLLKGTSARDGLELTGTVASEEGEHRWRQPVCSVVAAERGKGTPEDLLCTEAPPLQDTPRERLTTLSLCRVLPGTTAEARVGQRGVLEEVTLKKPGGLKQHDASTDEVPSVKSKRLSQGLDCFLETSWCWR